MIGGRLLAAGAQDKKMGCWLLAAGGPKKGCFYTAQSKIIISTKPTVKPKVGRLLCGSACDSGINSSTTTYIIAPAAKANR